MRVSFLSTISYISVLFLSLATAEEDGITTDITPPDRPCVSRDFGRGSIVCVCNSTYCDTTEVKVIVNGGGGESDQVPVQVWTSTKSGSRLHKSIIYFNTDGKERVYGSQHFLSPLDKNHFRNKEQSQQPMQRRFSWLRRFTERSGSRFLPFFNAPLEFTDAVTTKNAPSFNDVNIFHYVGDFPRPNKLHKLTIRKDVQFQKILGFGGSFTDSFGINIASLSNRTQENLMNSYFSENGSNYSLVRVPMGGTDFSTRPYTYDDNVTQSVTGKTEDLDLAYFALQPEDYDLKIPYIKRALSLKSGELKMIASPWSAPAWMKTRNSIHGLGILKKEYYQLWADYFVRFLEEYKKENISFWAVTTGNEPMNGHIPHWPFNCMGWTAADMARWIGNNLGPTLAASKPGLDVKIITLDDNKGAISTWAKEILDSESSARYVDGIGTHWYFDFLTGSDVLSRFHKKYPDYFIVQTEASLGFVPWESERGVILGSWLRAETYVEAIIRDMRNWVGGWIDWNLALDLKGGPNWANFNADAAVLVNPSQDEFFKQPIYYGLAHFSKFVLPESYRIDLKLKDAPRNLQYVAFLRPDDAVVVVFMSKLNYDAQVSIFDETRGTLRFNIPAQSFQTIMYQ